MGFLSDIIGVAAPIAGKILGGPVGGAIGSAVGGLVAGGGNSGEQATQQATAEQLAAIKEAQDRVELGATTSQGFLEPFAGVGQQGLDLAGFLGDPQAQFDSIQSNPLFKMGLQNLNEQTNQSAASRSRLSSGDTLERLTQNATLAATPLIDRQRQDILNLLNIGQNTAGQQVGVEQNASQQIADLITGGGATQASGTIAGENAAAAQSGNIFDIGTQLAGNSDVQDFVGGLFGGNSSGGSATDYTGSQYANWLQG